MRMRFLAALILFASQAGAAGGIWLKLNTPRFQVLSQTNEADLRLLAGHLETAAGILDRLEPGAGRPTDPVRVVIFSSKTDFERHSVHRKPAERGYYHYGSGDQTIVFLHTPASSRSVIFHEYGHLAVHRAGGRVSAWLDEGLAELYSTIRLQRRDVVWGGPAPSRIPHLGSGGLLQPREFLEISEAARDHSGFRAAVFYSQAWAFTHMLEFGRGYAGKLSEFRSLLRQNVPEPEAFERAFGKSREAALQELPAYVGIGRYGEQPLPVSTPEPVATGQVSRCSPEEVAFALAGLLIQLGRTDEARRTYQQLLGRKASDADVMKLLGDLALAQGLREEARGHYERALASGSKNAALHFEYAMLLRDANEPAERVRALVERALELDPNLPGLQHFLGNRALDEGDYALAIQRLSGAVLLQPQEPSIWLALAYAHRAAGDRDAARASAEHSAKLARHPEQRNMADAAVEELQRPHPPPPAPPGPKTIVPDSWKNAEGNQRIEGTLVRIDCQGASANLHVRTAARVEVLTVRDPRRVVLRNAPGSSQEFRCGTFEGVKVAVEFVARPAPPAEDAPGEVTALEFQ